MMTYLIQYEGCPMGMALQQLVAQLIENSGVCIGNALHFRQLEEGETIQTIQESPVKQAIIVIGQKFTTQLTGSSKNITMFAVSLWSAMQQENDNVVRKAVYILATQPLAEFVHLANSYGLGNPELDTIRSINHYNPYQP